MSAESPDSPSPEGEGVVSSEGDEDQDKEELIRSPPPQSMTSDTAPPGCHGWAAAYVLLSSVVAAIGGLLFGYDTGIISGALLQLAVQYDLTCSMQEILVAAMLMGALIASCVGGFLVDFIGRKVSIIVTSIIFFTGAFVLAFANSYEVLIAGRIVVGFGVSLSATAECIYISEIAPASRRGGLVSLNELAITVGFLLAYCMNLAFIDFKEGWRYMFGLAAIPASLQCIALIFLPYSPRYLMIKEKEEQAALTLEQLRGTDLVDAELHSIKVSLQEQQGTHIWDLFRCSDNMLKRLLIAMGLVFFQQCTGQANVLYYAPTVFLSLGFGSATAAILASVGLGVVKVLFTGITIWFIDRAGRRKFLIGGSVLMALSLLTLAIVTATVTSDDVIDPCLGENEPNSSFVPDANSPLNITRLHGSVLTGDVTVNSTKLEDNSGYSSLALLALMAYVSGYSIGFGPVSWLVISEIFPSRLKGRAASTAAIVNWSSNLMVSWTFLDMLSDIGVPFTFLIYAFICLASVVFIFCCVPETKARTLEQIAADLQHESYRIGAW